MIDPKGVEMKDLNEKAYDWTNQTVKERIESAVRLLKVHGFINDESAANAQSLLKKMEQDIEDENKKPKKKSKWVTDGVPEEEGYYIATTNGTSALPVFFSTSGQWMRPDNSIFLSNEIKAWRKLPKPYRGSRE